MWTSRCLFLASLTLLLILLLVPTEPCHAGRNSHGALIVHTADYSFTADPCDDDYIDPMICQNAVTQTDADESTPALIWFIAAFPEPLDPLVTEVRFGHDHNLPPGSHIASGFCGPRGTRDWPSPGWPESPEHAGNVVDFADPFMSGRFFPFYWVMVLGFEGAYYGTAIHPGFGYASFADNSSPPVIDSVENFGQVRWYEPGHNECPPAPPRAPCCLVTGQCVLLPDFMCESEGGLFLPNEPSCDPYPCDEYAAACCTGAYECEILLEIQCDLIDGLHLPDEPTCDPDPCPAYALACCLITGECQLLLYSQCIAAGGKVLPDEPACEPDPCPGYAAACCLTTGECLLVVDVQCASIGGDFLSDEPACDPSPCPEYPGACCDWNGECEILTADDCADAGGSWQGVETTCSPNPCSALGACCYGDSCIGECIILTEFACYETNGGWWWIEAEMCDPYICIWCPAVEETTWGQLKATYRR